MAPRPPDLKVVEDFLKGKVTLQEITVLRNVSHATRVAVAQVLVLCAPELFLKQPYERLVLDQPLSDWFGDIFGEELAPRVQAASRNLDMHHRHGASGIQLIVQPELHALAEKYGNKEAVGGALAAIARRTAKRANSLVQECAAGTTTQRKVELTVRFLIGTMDDGELGQLTGKLQDYLHRAQHHH